MLMRSLVFANECVHLINFEKLRSIKTRAELNERHHPNCCWMGLQRRPDRRLRTSWRRGG